MNHHNQKRKSKATSVKVALTSENCKLGSCYGIRPAALKYTPLESVVWGFIKNNNEVKILMAG